MEGATYLFSESSLVGVMLFYGRLWSVNRPHLGQALARRLFAVKREKLGESSYAGYEEVDVEKE